LLTDRSLPKSAETFSVFLAAQIPELLRFCVPGDVLRGACCDEQRILEVILQSVQRIWWVLERVAKGFDYFAFRTKYARVSCFLWALFSSFLV